MAVLGRIVKQGVTISNKLKRPRPAAGIQQRKTLRKLLNKAQHTAIGMHYGFEEILYSDDPETEFKAKLPIVDYDGMHPWWKQAEEGAQDVAWPGKIKYFALSSGTSGAPSKHIPVSKEMIRAIRKTSVRQIFTLNKYDFKSSIFQKQVLTISGSTHFQDYGTHYKGDVSGINVKKIPLLLKTWNKPGKKISKVQEWEERLNLMIKQAPSWDIGIIAGVPAWFQILLTRIMETYNLKNIHEMWPNFQVFLHGGVSLDPYRTQLEKLYGRQVTYIETYLASEGFLAIQSRPNAPGMEIVLNTGIYFEFIPFNQEYFDSEGQLIKADTHTLSIEEVELNTPYALVISTCAGAWRYMIGDVIRFVSFGPPELIIEGRTKHFLSLCGEHLSVDNMTQALKNTAEQFDASLPEFSVAGINHESLFAHQWFIGYENEAPDPEQIKQALDQHLKQLNDDYAVEREHALKDVFVKLLPVELFSQFLKSMGKAGAQNKFPRVIKGPQLENWNAFLAEQGY